MSRKGSLAKGNRIEKEFCVKLTEMGYIFDRAERSLRSIPAHMPPQFCGHCKKMATFTISKKHDTWGLFDVMAKHPGWADYTFYFQIATQWKSGADRRAIEAFPRGEKDVVCMVRKQDRQPFEIKRLGESGFMDGIDAWVEMSMEELFIHKKFLVPSHEFQATKQTEVIK